MPGIPSIGPLEIAIVLVIVLVIFGPKRLPQLGRSVGRGIRELKDSLSGSSDDDDSGGNLLEDEAEKEREDQSS